MYVYVYVYIYIYIHVYVYTLLSFLGEPLGTEPSSATPRQPIAEKKAYS